MNNFYPLSVSYLTYCVTTNVIKFGNAICLNFSQDAKILFPPGQYFLKKQWITSKSKTINLRPMLSQVLKYILT